MIDVRSIVKVLAFLILALWTFSLHPMIEEE